jgi:hypothetical protein
VTGWLRRDVAISRERDGWLRETERQTGHHLTWIGVHLSLTRRHIRDTLLPIKFRETIFCGKAFRLQYKWTLPDRRFDEK